ncbi:MAG: Ger(x)C family spore germination protein [Bacillota bacterium]|nr:Ger(x)C family spore germination protein [Bacillota bacterium]
MRLKALILIVILIPFLAGCWDVEEISKRGIANTVFFDSEHPKQRKMGVVLSVPGSEVPPIVGTVQQFEKRHYVITGEGNSFVDAWTEIQATTIRNIFFGQTKAIVLSEELARQNINDILDFIGRIPLIPPNTHVLIAKEDPEKLFEMKNRDNFTPGNYIDFYFRSRPIRSLAIPIELWRVSSIIDENTGDPFIPLIKSSQGNYLIAGTALFSQNRMVGELSEEETKTFALMRGTDVGYLTIPLGPDQHVALAKVKTGTEITPEFSPNGSLTFHLTVEANGSLLETFPHREVNWQEKKEIERKAEKLIKKDIKDLISTFQSLNTDPVGFGGKVRITHPEEWEAMDWNSVYPTVNFTVETKFSVRETGLYR